MYGSILSPLLRKVKSKANLYFFRHAIVTDQCGNSASFRKLTNEALLFWSILDYGSAMVREAESLCPHFRGIIANVTDRMMSRLMNKNVASAREKLIKLR